MEVAQFSDQFLEDQGISPPAENLCHDAAVPRFLKDLEQQLLKRRAAPRMLSQDLCLSLAQRLLLSLALQLEGRSRSLPIQETVWQFFNERYVNSDISAYGLADFWAALIRDSSKSKVLRLLKLVLEGDVDPTILCYVLLRAEILVMSLLSDMGHFKQCVQGLYPFLEEAEIERLLLEFTGYSHRCVSPPAVLGFFLHLILQHQEPLIRECQAVLSTYVKTSSGHLTVDELSRAVSELCPQLDRTRIEMSIQHSVTACGRPLFSLSNAACIPVSDLRAPCRWPIVSAYPPVIYGASTFMLWLLGLVICHKHGHM
ncbi:hypothetical protein GDO81_024117 [Engystomops pustulosus]|uniref:Uncharacterized protein n=1 Tax=Engystomops pustulosus TaxID=76066 RepID=A0AAV6ZN23_ENGPU|nr:hypothetical protein GDO81_024117 [Engystomops pustulosus]